jgi:hypothetical protein
MVGDMTNTTMNDTTTLIDDGYLAMWNETDAQRRRAIIDRTWTADGTYVDPLLEASGATALDGMVAGVHDRFPGHRFRRTSGIDVHHDRLRFGWELVAPDGSVTVAGVDVGQLTGERLQVITGFFGPLPEEGAAG